ncbi:type I-A CRISPR-associated protein Cas5 [Infirmifilum lucidum]|uniref:Type I-A CRISPR-associated protein Cas5 n=1 Tax=Infirmifilum lucidum TaxID=2776706 RepID=A0A7L9FHJ2_9CREN|nr:type I-A CRISPR-associated protein Cas5a [Infirmifilum lucidum]QOJ78822.1 type I-A CRISPR-associated protein Cas5 [Infirmifilum lucidum]
MAGSLSLRYVLAEVRPHGVVSLRVQPQSKARASLRYPSLTSLLGAISYPLAREDGREVVAADGSVEPRSAEFRRLFEHIAAEVVGEGYTYGSLYKINEYYRGKALQAVSALSNTFLYGEQDYRIRILYVLAGGVGEGEARLVERAAWGISRLGSRESVVSVEGVSSGTGRVYESDSVETTFSFEVRDGMAIKGSYELIASPDWRSGPLSDISRAARKRVAYPRGRVRVEGKGLRVFEFEEGVAIL